MDVLSSPNMSLPIPVVGVDLGPDWAYNVNSSLIILDGHNHSPGSGNQINPDGIDINVDLPMNNNDLTLVRTVRFFPQVSNPSNPEDIGVLYEVGVDLYYNDGDGNQIRITQGGSVTGSAGTITGLPSGTASASYAAGVFTFQAATNTPADIDGASFIFRNNVANSKGLTLSPPNAMGADFSLVLPNIPVIKSIMTMDTSGNMAADTTVDNNTIVIISNVIQAGPGITTASVPTGGVIQYGGTSAPTGFLMCDGTSYLRTAQAGLFAIIGTSYGAADGTHFNVPDMRGMFARGVAQGSANDPDRTTRSANNPGGAIGDNVGSQQGWSVQDHVHTVSDPGHGHVERGNTTGAGGGTAVDATADNGVPNSNSASSTANAVTGITIPSSGATTAGNQTAPINVYFNFIIKT